MDGSGIAPLEPRCLLDLPAELLDQIYAYLDWDMETDLEPARPDVISLSFTCKRLRETALPALFRHVTLRLRWCNNVLLEPALFRICADHLELARHVRTVTVAVEYDQLSPSLPPPSSYFALEKSWAKLQREFEASKQHRAFTVNSNLEDWLNSGTLCEQPRTESGTTPLRVRALERWAALKDQLEAAGGSLADLAWSVDHQAKERQQAYAHQARRKEEYLQELCKQEDEQRKFSETGQWPRDIDYRRNDAGAHTPPPKDRMMSTEKSRAKLRLDAVALALACIPPSTRTLVLNAVAPRPGINDLQNFALATTAEIIAYLGSQLTSLSVLSREVTSYGMIDTSLARLERRMAQWGEALHFTPDILSQLQSLKTLRLSGAGADGAVMPTRKRLRRLQYWSQASQVLETLELWHIDADESELLPFLASFTSVRHIRLRHMKLSNAHGPRPASATWHLSQGLSLLQFAISFRRAMRTVSLSMHNVEHYHKEHVPSGALRFISKALCSAGNPADDERVQRLTQDFESFFPWWEVEEKEVIDKQLQAKEFGKLVDQAMCSRFRSVD